MAKLSLTGNPKFTRLARFLDPLGSKALREGPRGQVFARGVLELLWEASWKSGEARCGNSEDIEYLCGWTGEPGALTNALLTAGEPKAGFIEPFTGHERGKSTGPQYQIHDFLDHCPKHVRSKRENLGIKVCPICGGEYFAARKDATFCSNRCRQIAYRSRGGDLDQHDNPDDNQTEDDHEPSMTALLRIKKRAVTAVTDNQNTRNTSLQRDEKTGAKPALVTDVTDRYVLSRVPPYRTYVHKTHTDHYVGAEHAARQPRASSVADPPLKPEPVKGSHLDGTTGARKRAKPPAAEASSPIALTYPVVGKGGPWWHLREDQLANWQTLYPDLDVRGEARQALAWIQATPTRRKTAGGMPKCLVSWFNRSVDQPRGRGSPLPTVAVQSVDWMAFLAACPHTPRCDTAWRCDQARRLSAAKVKES